MKMMYGKPDLGSLALSLRLRVSDYLQDQYIQKPCSVYHYEPTAYFIRFSEGGGSFLCGLGPFPCVRPLSDLGRPTWVQILASFG